MTQPEGTTRETRSGAGRSVRIATRVGLGIVAIVALLGGSWWLHDSRTFQLFGEFVPSVATPDSVVALTFDDGPLVPYTDSILDLLDAYHVPATFFVVGESVARHPELAQRIVTRGHELGNHSYSHRRMILHGPAFYREEVERTDSLIHAAGQAGRIAFRPPYGNRLVGLPWFLSRTQRTTVLWSLQPDTWYQRGDSMAVHVLERARPGAIILVHVEVPSRREGRAALPKIIEGLQAKGYRFVTVSELMTHRRGARQAGAQAPRASRPSRYAGTPAS